MRDREGVEFEYDAAALTDPALAHVQLEPRMARYPCPQLPPHQQVTFGFLTEPCSDRWARLLMKRRLERENRELKKANEILKLASAFFAQAELDRRFKS